MHMKTPLFHALAAAAYIGLISLFFFYGSSLFGPDDNALMPMAMLSLFVLSAAIMGYLFLYRPILTYLEGDKAAALSFFFKTTGLFAGITLVFFALAFLISRI